jgi:hypothetical protein
MTERYANCPIREHAGDGAFVGRCDFYCPDNVCPRHGCIEDYPTLDDREVLVGNRRRKRSEARTA